MNRDEFCRLIKDRFPDISQQADKEYDRLWGDFIDDEFYSHTWFEALANAINNEMNIGTPSDIYKELFELISNIFDSGCDEVRDAIDVAFVENLFWQITGDKVSGWWGIMPRNLKGLYIGFHNRTPL